MAIKDLLPWNRDTKLEVLREEEEPINSLLNMQNDLDQMFDNFFNRPFGLGNFGDFQPVFSPKVDIAETDKEVVITADLPGLEADDVEISLANRVLTIRGEKKSEKEEKGRYFHRKERSYGSFRRDISLPAEVDDNQVEAVFKNGELKISAPKTTSSIAKRISVRKN